MPIPKGMEVAHNTDRITVIDTRTYLQIQQWDIQDTGHIQGVSWIEMFADATLHWIKFDTDTGYMLDGTTKGSYFLCEGL